MIDEKALREFICQISLISKEELDYNKSLLASGIIDSISLLELVSFIESECQIKINPLEMSLENFDSIEKILSFIKKRQN